jgi:hypothetical protein
VCAIVAFTRVINDVLHMIYSFRDDEEEEVADDTSMTDETLLVDPIDE